MKKTYWWRFLVVLLALLVLGYWFFSVKIDNINIFYSFTEPIGYLFISLLFVSFFLFFVSDIVFAHWFIFAFTWFIISFLWIANSPEYDSGFFSMMNFTKGIVARLMSVLFVLTSLGILFFASWKEKKASK